MCRRAYYLYKTKMYESIKYKSSLHSFHISSSLPAPSPPSSCLITIFRKIIQTVSKYYFLKTGNSTLFFASANLFYPSQFSSNLLQPFPSILIFALISSSPFDGGDRFFRQHNIFTISNGTQ